MEDIKVSIIVPVYNAEKFLKKCIESIVDQTLEEIEIILINDGSTDNSSIICEEYSKKFPKKIRYINNKNVGCSATRNLGINLSQGEYITFVDSDDYIEKNMYQNMYEKAKKENLDVVICGVKIYDLITNEVTYSFPKNIVTNYDYLKRENAISACYNKLYSRKQIVENDIYFPVDTHYAEDLYFSFINLVIAKNIGHLEECYYNYILYGENSINNIDKRIGLFISFDRLYNYLLEKNYLKDKVIKKLFYKALNQGPIKSIFFMLLNPERITIEEYYKYNKLYSEQLKKANFLSLKSKILAYYYKNIVWTIRTLRIYKILKKLKNIIK